MFSRQTVIFLHAAFMTLTMRVDQIAYLKDKFPDTNLLQIDVNGHGKTTTGRKHYTLYDQGDDIPALMDESGIFSAVFVGISGGSLIALRMALSDHIRVKGIIASSSVSRAATQSTIESFEKVYKAWVATPTPSENIMNFAIQGWGGNLDVNSDRCKTIKRDWETRYSGTVNVESIAACLNTRDDIIERLKDVKVPVLLIQGGDDRTWTVEEAEIERDALPNADLEIIKSAGHMLIFAREADDVNFLMEAFLKEQGYWVD